MLLFVLAFLGGTLTIFSPCVLPVIPFVFARANGPFRRNGLPTLIGMALTFAAVASLAAVGGSLVVRANQIGRAVALIALTILGLSLILPRLADRLTRPLVALGGRLQERASSSSAGFGSSLLLGVAVGFLWAPCAGPVLGLILTGAALSGASLKTTLLLMTFAAGAATSLGLATVAGARVFAAMKKSLGAEEWIRRGLGIAVLAGVVAVAFGWDTGLLARLSLANTTSLEQRFVTRLAGGPDVRRNEAAGTTAPATTSDQLPSLAGVTGWLNSAPLSAAELRGHVVLIDIWTYSCINCLRSLPYVKTWARRYGGDGLIVVGVHSPEFAFERDPENVRRAVRDLGITYPVALDDRFTVWKALENQYWPAQYLADTSGRIRYRVFGEGHDEEMESQIRALLTEAGHAPALPAAPGDVSPAGGAEAASSGLLQSPETYIGYRRAAHFLSPEPVQKDQPTTFTSPARLALNGWSLAGEWNVGPEAAVLVKAGGRIAFRYRARDLHLVMGPAANGRPVRFRIRLDGRPPMEDGGTDVKADGTGTITVQRLYQLVRSKDGSREHTFEIEFLDAGAEAYAFTFG